MKSPTELAGPRVRLCANDDHLWERVEPNENQRGLHEGPQVFQAKGRTCVVYSCAASWLPTYKLGLLELKQGQDPLDPASWVKRPLPVFSASEQTYGVGHSCFVRSPDQNEWWHVFHAKRDRRPGWRRAIFVQPMKVGKRGFPIFDRPVEEGSVMLRPSGEKVEVAGVPVVGFDRAAWNYYGHHQFIDWTSEKLQLGRVPLDPINDYRSGEKVVLDRKLWPDHRVEVTIDFAGDSSARDAGILFRCSGASVGYDAQRGYFAGLIPKSGLVILGTTDGTRWTELARARTDIDVSRPQRLSVDVLHDFITVRHNDSKAIQITDKTYTQGSVGLRVVDTHAVFSDLRISAGK